MQIKRATEVFINLEHCSIIVELVAVVRCTEDGHELVIGEELITFFHHLMSSYYEVKFMLL
jgi:hypothetical protein